MRGYKDVMKKIDKKKIKEYGAIALVLLVAIALMYISGIGCPVRYMTGIPCPGCGMTRAAVALLSLDFAQALHYHPMIFVLPIFAILYLWARYKGKSGNWILGFACVCLIVTYLIRIFILKDPVLEVDMAWGRIGRVISFFMK